MENKHKEFKPYDRVLVRDGDEKWQLDFYSYWDEEHNHHITLAYGDGILILDSHILPYEGNEHLLGTKDDPEEEIELEDGEKIICSDHISRMYSGNGSLEDFDGTANDRFCVKSDFSGYSYALRFSDFNPSDMEETRKHILCVKNGKVVRYKE